MSEIFSENTEKKIPKSIDDCTKPDKTSRDLWLWCERLEKWGKILFWIIIISGIILSITSAIQISKVTKGIYYTYTDTETSFSFVIFITSLLDTALYALIEYCTYHVIALLIGALASIVQNSKITANVALYAATRNPEQNANGTASASENEASETQHKPKVQRAHEWACANCKKMITSYPCAHCGHTPTDNCNQPESSKSVPNPPVVTDNKLSDNETVACPKCGCVQPNYLTVCWKCGQNL